MSLTVWNLLHVDNKKVLSFPEIHRKSTSKIPFLDGNDERHKEIKGDIVEYVQIKLER